MPRSDNKGDICSHLVGCKIWQEFKADGKLF